MRWPSWYAGTAADTTLDVGISCPPPAENHMPSQAAIPVRPPVPS